MKHHYRPVVTAQPAHDLCVGDLVRVDYLNMAGFGNSLKCPDDVLTHDGDLVIPMSDQTPLRQFDLTPLGFHRAPQWMSVGSPHADLARYRAEYPHASRIVALSPRWVGFDTNAVCRASEGSGADTFSGAAVGAPFPVSCDRATNCWLNIAAPDGPTICIPAVYDGSACVQGAQVAPAVARHLRRVADLAFTPATQGSPVVFYASSLGPWGGVSCIMQIVADLRDKGVNAHVVTHQEHKHDLTFRFRPYMIRNAGYLPAFLRQKFGDTGLLISTHWNSAESCLAAHKANPRWKLAAFWQDREDLFVDRRGQKSVIGDNAQLYPKIAPRVVNAKWYGAPAQDTTLIPVGIDTRIFRPETQDATRSKYRVLAMYRPSTPRRGAARLEKLYRDLRVEYGSSVELHVFGETPTGDWFNHSHGHLTPEQVAQAMRQTTVFVEPSDFQGFGLPGLEAMACGALLVSTDNKGIHEYGTHQVNCLIGEDLLSLVCEALEAPQPGLREAGVARAAEFDWSQISVTWHRWVQETMVGRP